jgi:hypothetical protein
MNATCTTSCEKNKNIRQIWEKSNRNSIENSHQQQQHRKTSYFDDYYYEGNGQAATREFDRERL